MQLGKWKRKMRDVKDRPLKQGAIKRQVSYMMAVPRSEMDAEGTPVPIEDQLKWENIVERLKGTEFFQTLSYKTGDPMEIVLSYNGTEYQATLGLESLDLPELYTINHQLTSADVTALKAAKGGLTVSMMFGENLLESYLVQLKLLSCVVPDMVGLVDFCSERILSGVWAAMAASSQVPPAPSYLYTMQAVSGEEDTVWLHTHGLNRCGSIELEILGSDKEHYQNHASVLQTVAGNILTREPLGEEREMFWVSTLSDGVQLVGTWLDWRVAVRFYGKKEVGGVEDHEGDSHIETGALLFYSSPEDLEKRQFVPISVYNDALSDNPVMMISCQETERMSALAVERLPFFRRELGKSEVHGLMKFGLVVDEEYRKEDSSNLEHLWFEVLSMSEDAVHCKRTQDAYYIKALNTGDELDLSLSQLTDWVLYTPECQVTPDSVYLLGLTDTELS